MIVLCGLEALIVIKMTCVNRARLYLVKIYIQDSVIYRTSPSFYTSLPCSFAPHEDLYTGPALHSIHRYRVRLHLMKIYIQDQPFILYIVTVFVCTS